MGIGSVRHKISIAKICKLHKKRDAVYSIESKWEWKLISMKNVVDRADSGRNSLAINRKSKKLHINYPN